MCDKYLLCGKRWNCAGNSIRVCTNLEARTKSKLAFLDAKGFTPSNPKEFSKFRMENSDKLSQVVE